MANTSSTGSGRYVTIYILGNATSAINAMRKTAAASKETETALARAGGKFKSAGAGMTQLGYSVSRVALPLAALGGYAVKSALDFEKSMTLVRTQAGGSAKEVGKLSKEVEKLSGKAAHGFGPNELAEALYPIRSDGFKAAEAMKVLSAASAGAVVGQASLSETANALGGALRTYGGGAKAANQDMNILNATVGFGKFKLEELDQALTSGFLVQAHKSGIGLKEIGTALDSLARKSVPPQVEATRLQKTLIQLESTSGIAKKSLAKIGISQYQLAEDMRKHGLISALEEIRAHLKRFGSGPEAEAIEGSILGSAFGRSKGSANVGALLGAIPEMKKIEAEKKHYNTLSQALAVIEQKSYYKIKGAVAELKKGLIELGNTLIPIVIPIFEKLAKAVQNAAEWFSKLPKGIKDVATYFGIAVVASGPLLILFGNFFKIIGSLIKILPGFGAAMGEAEDAGAVGVAGLLPQIAALTAAAAGVVAAYEAIKAIKNFFSSGSGGGARSRGAKAFKAFHQPSEFQANTQGALNIFKGAVPSLGGLAAVAPGSAAEAKYLKEHQQYGYGSTELGGKAAKGNGEDKALLKRLAERNEKIELHNHIYIDGKHVTDSVATHLRNHSQGPAATKIAEATVKNSNFYGARKSKPE